MLRLILKQHILLLTVSLLASQDLYGADSSLLKNSTFSRNLLQNQDDSTNTGEGQIERKRMSKLKVAGIASLIGVSTGFLSAVVIQEEECDSKYQDCWGIPVDEIQFFMGFTVGFLGTLLIYQFKVDIEERRSKQNEKNNLDVVDINHQVSKERMRFRPFFKQSKFGEKQVGVRLSYLF